MHPKVSVLCVTRNRPNQLRNAIKFFHSQTWPNKELVVVDDSDSDKRLDLSAEKDLRHILTDQRDSGLKHDIALDAAQGDILCYQDDDDYFSPLRIEREIAPLLDRRVDVVGFAVDYVLKFPGPLLFKMKPRSRLPRVENWVGNGVIGFKWADIHDNTAMWGRWAFSKVNRHVYGAVGQKVRFLNSLWAYGKKLEVIPNDGLFIYVRHPTNSWKFQEHLVFDQAHIPEWIQPELIVDIQYAVTQDLEGIGNAQYHQNR